MATAVTSKAQCSFFYLRLSVAGCIRWGEEGDDNDEHKHTHTHTHELDHDYEDEPGDNKGKVKFSDLKPELRAGSALADAASSQGREHPTTTACTIRRTKEAQRPWRSRRRMCTTRWNGTCGLADHGPVTSQALRGDCRAALLREQSQNVVRNVRVVVVLCSRPI
mmetsp:Transcript_48209/g.103240  ORF Transcript_48209/g.103240 Transcript_48209/m.103240 type:complete len:165 (-) Transcript_48209:1782-2276(-)